MLQIVHMECGEIILILIQIACRKWNGLDLQENIIIY